MMYTKNDLKEQLAAMGLNGGETILIHSSMKSVGQVDGGADTVLDAWSEFFADGLLLLPTHTAWRDLAEMQRSTLRERNTVTRPARRAAVMTG